MLYFMLIATLPSTSFLSFSSTLVNILWPLSTLFACCVILFCLEYLKNNFLYFLLSQNFLSVHSAAGLYEDLQSHLILRLCTKTGVLLVLGCLCDINVLHPHSLFRTFYIWILNGNLLRPVPVCTSSHSLMFFSQLLSIHYTSSISSEKCLECILFMF